MTIGQSIQKYRKQSGLSQDELGNRLFVSRQTVSLWEKDQTVPTIDNLLRLREIFGVPSDAILGFEPTDDEPSDNAREIYTFNFTEDEVRRINSLAAAPTYMRALFFIASELLLSIYVIPSFLHNDIARLLFVLLLVHMVYGIVNVVNYRKRNRKAEKTVAESIYEYKIYDEYMNVKVFRNNEKVLETKRYFKDIEKIYQLGEWILFEVGGTVYTVRKSDLSENSAFYSFMFNNPKKTVQNNMSVKMGILASAAFWASIISYVAATVTVELLAFAMGSILSVLWVYLAFLPVPLFSLVLGIVLKVKGFRYKKNLFAGIIVAIMLIYSSFIFFI